MTTKQEEIESLRAQLGHKINELGGEKLKRSELAEKNYKLEDQVQYLKTKYDKLYGEHLIAQMHMSEMKKSADGYAARAAQQLREVVARGAKRAEHDQEYAILREIIHSGNKLSEENLRIMAEKYPKASLRRLAMIADEFDMTVHPQLVEPEQEKKGGTWKATAALKDLKVWAMKWEPEKE